MTDVLVIGGGPAGLTAAIYLARFHLDVLVIDKGGSRAGLIPKTRNHAGFPGGISGADLVARMREQAEEYGARLKADEVVSLVKQDSGYIASTRSGSIEAQAVLLATGIVNFRPKMPVGLHDEALRRGLLRYCPICDGYEVTDKRVAVIGTAERGMREALFLRSYTADLTLIAPGGAHELQPAQIEQLGQAQINLRSGPCGGFALSEDKIQVVLGGEILTFDSIYPAMGSHMRSELAKMVGADASDEGCMIVDTHQRTNIPGLYAAGDVVKGLDQISHAMGEGGVAATTIRNDLAEQRPLRR